MNSAIELITGLFVSIPGEIWGAMIALSGVWISSRTQKTRLRAELQAQSEEADKQRKSDLRREIYLDATESLSRLASHIAQLPNLDPSSEEAMSPEALSQFSGLSAKLQLIAEPKTSKLASKVSTKYGILYLQALQQLLPLQNISIEKEIAEEALESIGDTITKTMAQIDALTRAGLSSYSVFEPLTIDMNTLVQKSDELQEQVRLLGRRKIQHQHDYMRWLLDRLREVTEPTVELSVALREELNIIGDIEEFRKNARENHEEIQSEFENLIELTNQHLESDQAADKQNSPT
tara:strand:+ start:166 stop:1041 length:876 start_codon:yes stop_codon:yes gene_type:complete